MRYFWEEWTNFVPNWTIAADSKSERLWCFFDCDLTVKSQSQKSDLFLGFFRNAWIDIVQIWTKTANQKLDGIRVSYNFDWKVKVKGQIFHFSISIHGSLWLNWFCSNLDYSSRFKNSKEYVAFMILTSRSKLVKVQCQKSKFLVSMQRLHRRCPLVQFVPTLQQ